MTKIKVGDRVKCLIDTTDCTIGNIYLITEVCCGSIRWEDDVSTNSANISYVNKHFKLVTKKDKVEKPYQRRTFKLLKDGPTMKKGSLVQERCDDGTQPYDMLNGDTHSKDPSYKISFTNRDLVQKQPEWFVEVFKVTPEYMTREELDQWEQFKKGKSYKISYKITASKSKTGEPVTTVRTKNLKRSRAMKASWERRKANNG